jgi:hypothetical protein
MKQKFKLALASVCVVAAGFGGMKAYNAANQSETDLLLAENVEALTHEETKEGYHVHHMKYFNPVTNLDTGKCTAFSYYGPNGPCSSPHDHNPEACCSVNC